MLNSSCLKSTAKLGKNNEKNKFQKHHVSKIVVNTLIYKMLHNCKQYLRHTYFCLPMVLILNRFTSLKLLKNIIRALLLQTEPTDFL